MTVLAKQILKAPIFIIALNLQPLVRNYYSNCERFKASISSKGLRRARNINSL